VNGLGEQVAITEPLDRVREGGPIFDLRQAGALGTRLDRLVPPMQPQSEQQNRAARDEQRDERVQPDRGGDRSVVDHPGENSGFHGATPRIPGTQADDWVMAEAINVQVVHLAGAGAIAPVPQ